MRPGAIQVAGIHDVAEAELLLRHGVDFLGLPLRLDVHAEDCGDAEARRIVSWVSGRAECVLITYLVEPEAIAALARRIGVGWVQLHATMDPVAVAQLRTRAPELRVARSLVIKHGPG